MLASGATARQFEAEIASYLGTTGAVACGSGTGALGLALRALGISPGDEVVCPSYVCRDVVAAIRMVGASPVLCDAGVGGWCATVESVARAMTPRTRAIVAVHIFGTCADVAGMSALGVPVVEDCAHALGTTIGESKAGTIGALGIFSFHATKMLATGEGGAVVANAPELLERVREARDRREIASPMSDLAAALGSAQLGRFGEFLLRRRKLAQLYFDGLPEALTEPLRRQAEGSAFFRFPVRWSASSYAEAQSAFASSGVSVRRGVDQLNHRIAGIHDALFPNSVNRFETTVSLPIYPALADEDAARILDAARTLARAV